MTDPIDRGAGSKRDYPGTPRWVKIFIVSVVALVLMLVLSVALGLHTPTGHGG